MITFKIMSEFINDGEIEALIGSISIVGGCVLYWWCAYMFVTYRKEKINKRTIRVQCPNYEV